MLHTLQFRHDTQTLIHDTQPQYYRVANLHVKVRGFRLQQRSWGLLCVPLLHLQNLFRLKSGKFRLCEQKIRWKCVTYLTANSLEVW